MNEIWEKVKQYDTITIFGHVIPDGDCYGSTMGMKYAILDNFEDKKVYCLGSGWPKYFDMMGAVDTIEDEVIENSLAIVIDVANVERVEDQRFLKAKEIIKIDHHIPQGDFPASITLVQTEKIAACQIVTELIVNDNLKLTPRSATPLFLGLITDSGRFMYQPIDSNAYRMAASLNDAGAEVGKIYDRLYEVDEKSIRVKGYLMSHYKKTPNGVIYLTLDKETLHELGIDHNQGASMVNTLANIKGYPIWVFFAEADNGMVRVEFRSKGVPVQPTAVKFGGGGHLQAAGCKLDNLEDHKYVVKALDDVLKGRK